MENRARNVTHGHDARPLVGYTTSVLRHSWSFVMAVLLSGCPRNLGVDHRLEVAVTVDDLPRHGPLDGGRTRASLAERMLATFAKHHLPPVTGFVNGARLDAETEPVLVAWRGAGHHLANHSFSHRDLNESTVAEFLADVKANDAVLERFEPDASARAFFRYPYLHEGDTLEKRNAVRASLMARGLRLAPVSIDADDWAFTPPWVRCAERGDSAMLARLEAEFVAVHLDELRRMRELGRRLEGRETAQVLLLHLGAADVAALDALLTAFEREGVRWVSLEAALEDSLFRADPALAQTSGSAQPYRLAKARGLTVDPPIFARGLEERLDTICR